jgi:uncharacterized protein YdeI (YjbR/CyaY-like superfamily)
LEGHRLKKDGVWLVFYKKTSRRSTVSYEDALDGALAYGWIDSMIKRIDDLRYARKFTPRRPGSIWSKSNIDRVRALREGGMMTVWGLRAFDRRTGKVSLAVKFDAKEMTVPLDFEEALRSSGKARDNFANFAPSYRRRYLLWISAAKGPATRQRRITEAVELISRNVKNLLK